MTQLMRGRSIAGRVSLALALAGVFALAGGVDNEAVAADTIYTYNVSGSTTGNSITCGEPLSISGTLSIDATVDTLTAVDLLINGTYRSANYGCLLVPNITFDLGGSGTYGSLPDDIIFYGSFAPDGQQDFWDLFATTGSYIGGVDFTANLLDDEDFGDTAISNVNLDLVTPEPSSVALLSGLIGPFLVALGAKRRRRRTAIS